jgi:hypothetical protein
MKKLVKFIISATLFSAIFRVGVNAQPHESATITVNATVLSALSIADINDANFGNISATTTGDIFLDPQGSENSYVGATATAGQLSICGNETESILVGWPVSILLSDGAGNDITFTLAVSGLDTNSQSESTDLFLEGGYLTLTLVENHFYLWVGGSLGVLNGATAGEYSGTADFTVEYN